MTSSVQVFVFPMGLVFLTSHWVGGKEVKWDVGVPWGGLTDGSSLSLEKRGSYEQAKNKHQLSSHFT